VKSKHNRKWAAWHYATGLCITLALAVLALVSAAPLLIKLFVPIPSLDAAEYWTGRVEVEGYFKVERFGSTIPRQYIVTPAGRHEFKEGLFGHRIAFSNVRHLDGAVGEIWYHPLFGALQWRFLIQNGQFKGEVEEGALIGLDNYLNRHFVYGRYAGMLALAILLFCFACVFAKRMMLSLNLKHAGRCDVVQSGSCR
jgi:hypothetical protein